MWLLGRIIYWCLLYQITGANYLICRHFKIRHILSVLQALLYTFWARIIYILSSERWSQPSNVCLLQFLSIFSTFAPVIWAMIAAILYLSSSVFPQFFDFSDFLNFCPGHLSNDSSHLLNSRFSDQILKEIIPSQSGSSEQLLSPSWAPPSSPTAPGFSQLFSNFTRPMPFYLCPL